MFIRLAYCLCVSVFTLTSTAFAQIPIDHFSKNPAFASLSMSADGTYIAGLVTLEGESDQALAIWQTDDLSKAPVVTPANDRLKFVSAAALKAGKVFVVGQQTWTGNAGRYECLEGMSAAGAVKT